MYIINFRINILFTYNVLVIIKDFLLKTWYNTTTKRGVKI